MSRVEWTSETDCGACCFFRGEVRDRLIRRSWQQNTSITFELQDTLPVQEILQLLPGRQGSVDTANMPELGLLQGLQVQTGLALQRHREDKPWVSRKRAEPREHSG